MAPTITLYDFPSTPSSHLKGANWNPNVFKARIALAYKGIPYDVKFIEYSEIESVLVPLGGVATSKKPDGSDLFTLPAIVDHANSEKCVVDSLEIARYLDARFPDAPKLVTINGDTDLEGLISLEQAQLSACLGKIFGPMMAKTCAIMNPGSEGYFRKTREAFFNAKLEDLLPAAGAQDEATWGAFVEALDKLAALYPYSSNPEKGLWILGSRFTFADTLPLAFLNWIRAINGPASAEWQRIAGSGKGFWSKQLEEADKNGWFKSV